MIIGTPDDSMEKLFDELLEHLEQFDKRTSAKIQREILREAIRPAAQALRSATREAYGVRTGRARKSIRANRTRQEVDTRDREGLPQAPRHTVRDVRLEQ